MFRKWPRCGQAMAFSVLRRLGLILSNRSLGDRTVPFWEDASDLRAAVMTLSHVNRYHHPLVWTASIMLHRWCQDDEAGQSHREGVECYQDGKSDQSRKRASSVAGSLFRLARNSIDLFFPGMPLRESRWRRPDASLTGSQNPTCHDEAFSRPTTTLNNNAARDDSI
jgi:hypothetical protein